MKYNNFIRKFFRIPLYLKIHIFIACNRIFFSLIGIHYGKNMRIYNRVYVTGQGHITIGDNFVFISGDSINPICRNICGSFYTSLNGEIIIGNNVGISSACLWANKRIVIGNNVNIGGDCLIMDTDAHPVDYLKRRDAYCSSVSWREYQKEIPNKPIYIEDDVWIGARCIILKGIRIGAKSVIAAGSVVTKSIPSNVIAGGNPCTVIKKINCND